MYLEKTKKAFFKMMNDRLHQEGWETVTQFTAKSKIPYTVETVRRAFTDCGHKQLSADTLAIILRYLSCSRQEIRQILKTYTDDKEIIELIGDDGSQELTPDQQAWLDIYNKLYAQNPSFATQLAQPLEWIASLASVDISKETALLGRKKGGT